MKVYILAPKENWIIDRISSEFKKTHCNIVTQNLMDADIIWAAAGWCWNHLPLDVLRLKKIILSVHHEVPEKFDLEKKKVFQIRDQFVDFYHVPAKKTKDFIKDYTDKNIEVLSYWYDESIWQPISKEKSRRELLLPEDKFIIGSFQRDTEGHDLKSPKLEKGPDIFCDYVEKLYKNRKNIHVLLGGWRRQYVIKRLEDKGIPYTYFEMAPLEKLQKMYASCDLYVVGSRYEGGPQSILEASAMKVPIISNDVGIASEVLSPNCVIDVENNVYYPTKKDIEDNWKKVQNFELKKLSNQYVDLFEKVSKLK